MSSNTYFKPFAGFKAGHLLLTAALVLLLGSTLSQAHAHLDEPQEPACVLCSISGDDIHTSVEASHAATRWQQSTAAVHPAESHLPSPQLCQGLPRAPPAN